MTAVSFGGPAPYDYVVSSSTRLQLFDAATNAPKKLFSRFQDLAYSGHLRAECGPLPHLVLCSPP